jgi:DNA-binding LytR/AlgR family response regulator
MISYVILEDEVSDLKTLRSYLKSDSRFFEKDSFCRIEQFDAFHKQHKVDLVFADVKLSDGNLLKHWEKLHNRPELILISSFSQYALPAFANEALHFITKPIKPEILYTALERAHRKIQLKINQKELTFFFVQSGKNKYSRVAFDELISIEAEGEYLRLHLTEEREILVFKRLKSLLSELPTSEFKQIHPSYIININHIDSIDFHEVEMRNKQIFAVGKTYKSTIQDILEGNTTTL